MVTSLTLMDVSATELVGRELGDACNDTDGLSVVDGSVDECVDLGITGAENVVQISKF